VPTTVKSTGIQREEGGLLDGGQRADVDGHGGGVPGLPGGIP
jgi:hypothetical protein